jgi:hypothetical protein
VEEAPRLYQLAETENKFGKTMRWKFALAIIKLTEYLRCDFIYEVGIAKT